MREIYSSTYQKSNTLLGKMLYNDSDFEKVGALIVKLEKNL